MAFGDSDPLQREITADLSQLTPLHDFVLVKPISDDAVIESQAFGSKPVLIHNPAKHMTGDYRWRSDRPRGNRIGKVVAIGRGDRMIPEICLNCEMGRYSWEELSSGVTVDTTPWRSRLAGAKRRRCSNCGAEQVVFPYMDFRAPMNVAPGDTVVFPRVPANEIQINGENYVFLHEESQVYAVLEEAA